LPAEENLLNFFLKLIVVEIIAFLIKSCSRAKSYFVQSL